MIHDGCNCIDRMGGVGLRAFVPADLADMRAVFADPEVMRHSGSGVRDDAAIAVWIARQIALYPRGLGRRAICLAGDPRAIGYAGLMVEAGRLEPGEVELSYRLSRRHWGRGIASAAARAAIGPAAGLGAARVVAIIDPANAASVRVASRLGMGFLREAMFPGYEHPDHVYALDLPGGGRA